MYELNILSLFDGISCGQEALDRAGIKYNNYYASEIDKFAIQIAQKNYPNTIQLGDIKQWQDWEKIKPINVIMAGFPCQAFSLAGKRLGLDDERGSIIHHMFDVINYYKPRIVLLENVTGLLSHNKGKTFEYIKKTLKEIGHGYSVKHITINSSLVSAQNRNRVYIVCEDIMCGVWIDELKPPKDKGILLKDIIINNKNYLTLEKYNKYSKVSKAKIKTKLRTLNDKSMTLTANSQTMTGDSCTVIQEKYFLSKTQINSLDKNINKGAKINPQKSPTLRACSPNNMRGAYVDNNNNRYRKLTPLECERLQTLPVGYTNGVSDSQRYKLIGNGWTIDIIAHLLKQII